MQKKLTLVKRTVAGDNILVPVGAATLKLQGLVTVNGVGAFIWDSLEAAASPSELADLVAAEYEVDRETAERDVREFLDRLGELGIL